MPFFFSVNEIGKEIVMKIKTKGFAVLTTVVMLSAAGMLYTVNMVYAQLIDNRILGNYYRNNEAFTYAESGIQFVLSQLNEPTRMKEIVDNLPYLYPEQVVGETHYQVTVERLMPQKLNITAVGYSQDHSAMREVALQVYDLVDFDIPTAALSSNGKLNLNSTAFINAGCEGVIESECHSATNIAEQMVIASADSGQECENNDPDVSMLDYSVSYISQQQWGETPVIEGTLFDTFSVISPPEQARSLFEKTFAVTLVDAKAGLKNASDVAYIDMHDLSSVSCSEQLMGVDPQTSVIYIKGDCNIDVNDLAHSQPDIARFSIGSVTYPKIVFIEGGRFIVQPTTGVSVVGMLYFIPTEILTEQGIDLSGIRVNGALLSEYHCSHNTYDLEASHHKQRLSVRYDKYILNKLYQQLGMTANTSYYQLVEGSWRDF